MGKDWGRIVVGTRLEKTVPDDFMLVWSELISFALRPGDGWMIATKKTAHQAANTLVRRFLKETESETLMLIDSDCEIGKDFIESFRSYEPGWEFDVLQAFYVTRGWPPLPVWFDQAPDGRTRRIFVTELDHTAEVILCGNHCTLFRREIFIKQMEAQPEIPLEKFDFFWYPRHNPNGEDTAFSVEARKLGFRLGATTHVTAGHISQINTGWKTHLEWLERNQDKYESVDECLPLSPGGRDAACISDQPSMGLVSEDCPPNDGDKP
jgi:hypothetical protein